MRIPELQPGTIATVGLLGGLLLIGGYYGMEAWRERQAEATSYNPIDAASDAHALMFQPDDEHKLYVGTHDGLVRAFHDREWSRVGRVNADVQALAAHASDPLAFYAGIDKKGEPFGLQLSRDGGFTWNPLAFEGRHVHAIAIQPTDPGRLWASVDGELHASDDAGRTWRRIAPELPAVLALAPDGGSLLAATDTGIHRSDDAGLTWRVLSRAVATAIAVDATRNATILAANANDVHVSRDGGATWRALGLNAAAEVAAVLASPVEPQTYFAATASGTIHKTTDAGATWVRVWPPA